MTVTSPRDPATESVVSQEEDGFDLWSIVEAIAPRWRLLLATSAVACALAIGVSFLIPPIFTASVTIISPQQSNSAAGALASLGNLSSLAGSAIGAKNAADQYVAMMQSVSMTTSIIERFKLKDVYAKTYMIDARKELAKNVRITAGKKDNLIAIEVDDESPQRAADMANAYVDELRKLTDRLAVTEAQQRRMFFENQLNKAKSALAAAQTQLQKTGFTSDAIKAEPKAAAENYAGVKAKIAAQEVKLGAMRQTLTDNSSEVQTALATLSGLRSQLAQLEQPLSGSGNQDYVGAYRDFKYQEALFDIYARQFELAKMDEAREGALVQVLDAATPPEKKSKPHRSWFALAGAALGLLSAAAFVSVRHLRTTRAS
ncbi:MAG TPA: Wzz/FepE/Etk N-terminal domain-containing protein [Burkholderiaceae bacterium]